MLDVDWRFKKKSPTWGPRGPPLFWKNFPLPTCFLLGTLFLTAAIGHLESTLTNKKDLFFLGCKQPAYGLLDFEGFDQMFMGLLGWASPNVPG